jgi:hypothetical protein
MPPGKVSTHASPEILQDLNVLMARALEDPSAVHEKPFALVHKALAAVLENLPLEKSSD